MQSTNKCHSIPQTLHQNASVINFLFFVPIQTLFVELVGDVKSAFAVNPALIYKRSLLLCVITRRNES